MFRPTRLMSSVRGLTTRVRFRLQSTQQQLPFHLICLITGFFLGNIFGTFLNFLRRAVPWDGFIIGAFICLCEYISFQTYRRRTRPRNGSVSDEHPVFGSWRPLNLLKLGLLFGFFVDAFKVGS